MIDINCLGKIFINNIEQKQNNHSCGYLVYKKKLVHRLVAEKYIPNFAKKPNINHKFGNKKDNRVMQIEWCTQKENIKHSWDIGLHKQCYLKNIKSSEHPMAKTCLQISKDGFLVGVYDSYKEAKEKTGINNVCICQTVKGIRKTAGGYIWK